jgi:hypothetical protein
MTTTLSKTGLVVGAVKRHESVGQPGDRVALAGAGAVLDEVRIPRTLGAGGGLEPADGFPLVEPREDDRAGLELRGVGGALARHQVDETPEDVEPGIAGADVLPGELAVLLPPCCSWRRRSKFGSTAWQAPLATPGLRSAVLASREGTR